MPQRGLAPQCHSNVRESRTNVSAFFVEHSDDPDSTIRQIIALLGQALLQAPQDHVFFEIYGHSSRDAIAINFFDMNMHFFYWEM
jgi:hypothetical protein